MKGHTLPHLATFVLIAGGVLASPARAVAQPNMACVALEVAPLDERGSPLDSLILTVGGEEVKICYGRPSARGRTMLGTGSDIEMGKVPFGKIWRTGANEPTLLITPIDLLIGDMPVPAGTYSIYTVPGPTEWEIIVNRSYSQMGMETFYTDEVRAQEVGRISVASESTEDHVEMFTIRAETRATGVRVLLEWERTRVPIPIAAEGR